MNLTKKLQKFDNLEILNKNDFLKQRFDIFSKLVQKKQFINNILNLLNIILTKDKITIFDAKQLITSYTIYGYPDIVLNSPKDENDEKLYKFSEELLNSLELLFQNKTSDELHLFNNLFTQFSNFFNIWKEHDLTRIIKPYILSYYQYDEILKVIKDTGSQASPRHKATESAREVEDRALGLGVDDSKILEHETEDITIWSREINNLKERIEYDVKRIGGEKAISLLKNYEAPTISIEEKVYKQVEESVKKAYWNLFQQNIDKNDYSQIYNMLKDVEKMVFNLIPNRSDLHEKYKREINSELIKQMIDNKAINGNEIYKIMKNILNYLKMVQSPEDDQNGEDLLINIDYWFAENQKYSLILTKFFQYTFKKLEKTTKTIAIALSNVIKKQSGNEKISKPRLRQ